MILRLLSVNSWRVRRLTMAAAFASSIGCNHVSDPCPAGTTLFSGACQKVCAVHAHCRVEDDASPQYCSANGVCATVPDGQVPRIDRIDGNGIDAVGAAGSATFRDSLIVHGIHLEGAELYLIGDPARGTRSYGKLVTAPKATGEGSTATAEARDSSAGPDISPSSLTAQLPEDLERGRYFLELRTEKGTDSTPITILQGERGATGQRGPPGPQGPKGDNATIAHAGSFDLTRSSPGVSTRRLGRLVEKHLCYLTRVYQSDTGGDRKATSCRLYHDDGDWVLEASVTSLDGDSTAHAGVKCTAMCAKFR